MLLLLNLMRKLSRLFLKPLKKLVMNLEKISASQWMPLHLSGKRVQSENINFQRLELSIHLNSLLSIGNPLWKNILLSQSRMHLTKRTGKAGRNSQKNLVTRFSLSVMTFLSQTLKDFQKVFNSAAEIQSLSS